jgi:hypothetical protein
MPCSNEPVARRSATETVVQGPPKEVGPLPHSLAQQPTSLVKDLPLEAGDPGHGQRGIIETGSKPNARRIGE